MNERFYADFDNDTGDWCVFDSSAEPHKAVSSWSCEQDALDDAARRKEGQLNTQNLKVTIEIEVDEGWVDFVVNNNDLFMRSYCGYWLFGVEFDDDLGWLGYVDDDGGSPNDVEAQSAIKAWKSGEVLPTGFYRLDRKAAIEAFRQGVIWRGSKWYENGDANSYDYVIQMALLGSIVYG